MIEKIMKAVKSSNKKRSRNITIGAVIGFLLSCTAVMGVTEDNYLWIKDDNGEIKFSTNGREWNNENPYSENSWNTTTNTYTNNITLSGKGNGVSGANYGLKLGTITNLNSEFKFINNGVISGTGSGNSACGILYNGQGKIEAITNKGEISGKSSTRNSDSGYGINISSEERETVRKIGTLNNIGKIYGESTSNDGYGIYISNQTGEITTINNTGIISGKSTGKRNSGYGIYIYGSSGEITTINNTGIISGKSTSNDGYGICNSRGTIGAINNTGVIYGKSWAINNSSGAINKVNNYGILVSCGSSTINGVNNKNNKGLIFGVTSAGTYTATDYDHFGQTYDVEETINSITKKYKVINAKAEGTENNITGTESLKLKNGTLTNGDSPTIDISSDERYILNGITNTLEVSGKNNELNDSVINAYKTAVVMGSNDSTLILNNTVVNGGLSGNDPTISVTGNKNILTIQGNSVVNGTMESTGENNTLNLYGKINNNLNKSNNRYEATSMNILNDISGFTNINIDNNVTFFEDVKVTGTEKVTVAETGTLNLRLKNTGSEETVDGKPIQKALMLFQAMKMKWLYREKEMVKIQQEL